MHTVRDQDPTTVYGFAKDGFPIYASCDDAGELPGGLDARSGHAHSTSEFPDGTDHCHASQTAVPNFLGCLSGVVVEQSFRYD